MSKSGPDQSAADTDVTYNVMLLNVGPNAAVSVTLNDPIPAGMTFVSSSNSPGFSCSTPAPGFGGTITCTAAAMLAGATANFTFVVHIAAGTPPGTTFTNIATATSATFDPNDENNSGAASTSTPPPPLSDAFVLKTGPSAAGPDSDVAFTITAGNSGPDAAASVTLQDTLPGTMTFVSLVQDSGPAMSCSTPAAGAGGTITCTAATMPAGTVVEFTLTGHIPSGTSTGTSFTNTATISTTTDDPSDENNAGTHTVFVSSVDLSVVKSGPPVVAAGTNVTYMLTVANAGPDVASGVTLSDPLPPGTTFVSLTQDSGPPATCTSSGDVLCFFATLASGDSAQFTLVINSGGTSSITNTATVTSDNFDSDPSDNSSSVTTTVTPAADLAVTKSGPATVSASTNVTYTVTVFNNGPSSASTVSLTDVVPPNTTFVSATQTSGPMFTCTTPAPGASGTIMCDIAAFPAAATSTFSFVMRVDSSAPNGSPVSNTANIASPTSDPNASNNTSTVNSTVSNNADLAVTKTGPAAVTAGTQASYNITVTNNGPSDAVSVTLTDVLPPETTFASETQTSGPPFTCTNPPIGSPGTITCTIATFAAGATATFNVVVNVSRTATGPISNTASVSSATFDPTPANSSSTTSSAVTAPENVPTLSPIALALFALILAIAGITLQRSY